MDDISPLAAGDVTGDGRPDLVLPFSNYYGDNGVRVLVNRYRIGGGADGLVVRDLNADGRPDVVVSHGEAGPFVPVLLNRGGGTFGPKHDYLGSGRFALAVGVADVNHDWGPDLLGANGERGQAVGHGISVLLNRGDGAFALRGSLAPRARVLAIAIGDLNGDGREDLLVQTLHGLLVLLKR